MNRLFCNITTTIVAAGFASLGITTLAQINSFSTSSSSTSLISMSSMPSFSTFSVGDNLMLRSTSSSSMSSNMTGTVNTKEVKGEIIKKDGERITVDEDDTNKTFEYILSNDNKVTKDTNTAKAEDIKVGDRVKVVVNSDKNTLISLEATSGKVFDIAKYAIPAVLLGLLLIALIVYLNNRSSKGKILTSTDSTRN